MARSNVSQDVRLHGHRVLGTFSTNTKREYCKGDLNRRFFREPEGALEFDYTRGFESYVHMGDDPVVSLNNVLRWMRDNRDTLIEKGILDPTRSRLNVDFVGRRGLLGRLLEARSNRDHRMTLLVTLYKGTYYITETSDGWRSGLDGQGQMIAASSKLFLRFVTSKDGINPDAPAPVNDNASFYAVMRTDCGKHRMLFTFEVQAEKKDSLASPPRNYVNVRTNAQQNIIKPLKALKWWAPNALSGIPLIVCGERNDERGIIERLTNVETDQLPRSYAQGKWNPGECIKNMESLLSQIKDAVEDDDANSVYQFVLEPVEGGPGLEQRLRSRKLVFKGKKGDDFTLITESQIQGILGR